METAGALRASENAGTQLRAPHPLRALEAIPILESKAVISISAHVHPPFLAQKIIIWFQHLNLQVWLVLAKKGREWGEISHLWFKLMLKYLGCAF